MSSIVIVPSSQAGRYLQLFTRNNVPLPPLCSEERGGEEARIGTGLFLSFRDGQQVDVPVRVSPGNILPLGRLSVFSFILYRIEDVPFFLPPTQEMRP